MAGASKMSGHGHGHGHGHVYGHVYGHDNLRRLARRA